MPPIQEHINSSIVLLNTVWPQGEKGGTGFFYRHISDESLKTISEPGWVTIEGQYLVTAKHCFLSETPGTLLLPDKVVLRYVFPQQNGIPAKQLEVPIERKLLEQHLIFSRDPSVDIAAIRVTNLIASVEAPELAGFPLNLSFVPTHAFTRNNLPKHSKLIEVEATSRIVIIGYPEGYHDEHNLFPLSKSGSIASGWGMRFNDEPCFKVDVQLFPVSSGSPVISEPTNIVVKDGKIMTNTQKDFLLLGVYLGEWQVPSKEECTLVQDGIEKKVELNRRRSLGIGTACYADEIEKMILDPISFEELKAL
ncbi:MAG: trypsin-like peptidase domain-containing protein [Candidatus Gracilibacteria bacterium]|jgi:V8-like Glu-specific endopeptidase